MRECIVYLLVVISIVSCGKGREEGIDPNDNENGGGETSTLSLSETDLVFTSEGGEKTFKITTNSDWTISNLSPWCKVNVTSGTGDYEVVVTVAESEEYSDRNTNLSIKVGNVAKILTINQKKKNALLLTKNKYNIPTEGDNISIEIRSNISYSVIIPKEYQEWIERQDLVRSLETKNIQFNISANPNTEKRNGCINTR